jgi:hypothetical protein
MNLISWWIVLRTKSSIISHDLWSCTRIFLILMIIVSSTMFNVHAFE